MDIGKKIREIRTEKLMTQSQLAGDEITRNMLSRIENGAALPSLGTVMYLAKRLGVPAGALLCDDNDEYNFKKSSLIKKIRDSFSASEYALCLDMCADSLTDADDEISYIAANCCLSLAEDNLIEGNLYEAKALIEEGIAYSEKTVYNVSEIPARAYVMLEFMKELSPMLDFDVSDMARSPYRSRMLSFESPICRYINTMWEIENQRLECAYVYISEENENPQKHSNLYVKHIEAKLEMINGDYSSALHTLRSILDFDGTPLKLLIYLVSKDMEICCREIEDYRGAYEFSETKLGLIESMLRGGL